MLRVTELKEVLDPVIAGIVGLEAKSVPLVLGRNMRREKTMGVHLMAGLRQWLAVQVEVCFGGLGSRESWSAALSDNAIVVTFLAPGSADVAEQGAAQGVTSGAVAWP